MVSHHILPSMTNLIFNPSRLNVTISANISKTTREIDYGNITDRYIKLEIIYDLSFYAMSFDLTLKCQMVRSHLNQIETNITHELYSNSFASMPLGTGYN